MKNMLSALQEGLLDFNDWYMNEGYRFDCVEGTVENEMIKAVQRVCPVGAYINLSQAEAAAWDDIYMAVKTIFLVNLTEKRALMKKARWLGAGGPTNARK